MQIYTYTIHIAFSFLLFFMYIKDEERKWIAVVVGIGDQIYILGLGSWPRALVSLRMNKQ